LVERAVEKYQDGLVHGLAGRSGPLAHVRSRGGRTWWVTWWLLSQNIRSLTKPHTIMTSD